MRDYIFFKQEKDNWCVPACFQMMLDSKGISLSQEEIANSLEIKNDGVYLNESILNKFLADFNLKCVHTNPNLGGLESDLLLRDELEEENDVFVAYDYYALCNASIFGFQNHFSIVADYKIPEDIVSLVDPGNGVVNVDLIKLNNSIRAIYDERYGFYIVKKK